jgi:hypothetical protein
MNEKGIVYSESEGSALLSWNSMKEERQKTHDTR